VSSSLRTRAALGEQPRLAEEAAEPAEGRLIPIGAAAALAGVSERTLRYYEELGLVTPAGHSPGGSRRYGPEQVARVQRIRELQELLGLDLDEIRALLAHDDRREELRAAWEASDDRSSRRAILEEAIEANTALRARLAAKRDRIDAFIGDLDERLARFTELLKEGAEAASSKG